MPAPPARTRTAESEARIARRERQRARETEAVERSVRLRRELPAEHDEDQQLLVWIYRRTLCGKNAKALRLAIELSEREALEKAKEAARLAKLRRQQDQVVQHLKGLVIVDSSDDDDSSSDESDAPPPADDGYNYAGDQKGKGPVRKW